MRVLKVRRVVLDQIGVETVSFDPAVLKIFYFKHEVRATNVTDFNKFYWQP